MKILPSIDLYEGKIVRLYQGNFKEIRKYPQTPANIAEGLLRSGFYELQVIDLEGAQRGKPTHTLLIKELSQKGLCIFYGGGLRTLKDINTAFENGAGYVYSGSMILKDPEMTKELFSRWKDRIIPAVDIRDRKVVLSGWKKEHNDNMISIFKNLSRRGFSRFLVTAVLQDGTMKGPDFSLYREILSVMPRLQLIAAGGISTIEDIARLAASGCWAAVTGRSFLDGELDLDQAKKVASTNA